MAYIVSTHVINIVGIETDYLVWNIAIKWFLGVQYAAKLANF